MLHDDETVRFISDLCENVGRRKDVIRSVVSVLADRGVVETFINTVTTAEINGTGILASFWPFVFLVESNS